MILICSFLVVVWPGPSVGVTILFGEVFDCREFAPLVFWNSLPVEVRVVGTSARVTFPLSREGSVVLVGSNVLEEQPVIAGFARVELGLELDRGNPFSLASITVEIRLTLRCRPSVDIQEGHSGCAVTVARGIIALFVEVVSHAIVPLFITVIIEVVNALVLKLEWELVRLVVSQCSFRVWLVVGHRDHASIGLLLLGFPVGWSYHGSGVGAIVAFKELSLH